MKRVGIIYTNTKNSKAMNYILQNLQEVFEGYVAFTNYYLEDFNEDTMLYENAYLAASGVPFQTLRNYVRDYTTIIKIHRSPERDSLKKIEQIPAGTNVLLVNDNYENALETVASFNDAGIGHITLIPYDKNLEHTDIYDELTVAVTPGEVPLVPARIRQIIDIGYRPVSFDTMYTLMKALDLDIDVINRNLFRHIQSVLESNTSFHDNYINSYLKSEMLNHIASKNKTAMLLVDNQYRIVYANAKADSVFQTDDIYKLNIRDYIDLRTLTDRQSSSEPLEIAGQQYLYNKYPFMLMDETVGYYITLQDKSDFDGSSRQNQKKGYVAKYQFKDIVHKSPAMKDVIDKALQIALSDHTILIRGESGTGKELIAQSIHNASFRSSGPFVAINCASLPETLLESELFGYDSGAFTGAREKGKIGLFEQANHGTLFLDEIGDFPLSLQSRLLRAIQEKQLMRLGSDHLIDVDVRIITATNKDLEAAVSAGTFRADLFFRLNVLPLSLPSLRNRKEDIPALLKHFLGNSWRNITETELRILLNYNWPGNIRELENMATYYNALSSLPDYLYQQTASASPAPSPQASADTQPAYPRSVSVPVSLSRTADIEDLKRIILEMISSGTAVSHGIGRSTILYALKDSGIDISDGKLRELLLSLKELGLIEIGKGRGGTRLTERGKDYLAVES